MLNKTPILMRRFINYRTLMTMLTVAAISCFNGDAFGQSTTESGSCTTTPTITSGNCSFSQGSGSDVSADNAAAFGGSTASGANSFAVSDSDASGDAATALSGGTASGGNSTAGSNATASGEAATAFGQRSEASGTDAVAIGKDSDSEGTQSITIGFGLKASSGFTNNHVIGSGINPTTFLTNGISNSLMIGYNSTVPTVFVEGSSGSGTWGRVGIGTTDPDGLLHMLDEDGDDTDLILERGLATDEARLVFQNESGVESSYISYVATNDLVIRNVDEDENLILSINDGGTTRNVITIEADDAQVGVNIGNPHSAIDVEALAIAGGEGIARFTTTDASNNDIISITNASATNGEFAGMISGFSSDINQPTLTLRAYTWDDSGTEPIMEFLVRDINDIDTRPLYAWKELNATHMLMDADGNLGIGTTAPSGTLEVAGTTYINTLPPNGSGNRVGIGAGNQLTDWDASSVHFKQNIEDLQFDKEMFLSMRPVKYNWKEVYGGDLDVGFIAQEVAEDFPPLATIKPRYEILEDGTIVRDSLGRAVVDSTELEPYSVKYGRLPVYLYLLAREQELTITELTDRVSQLQAMVESCCAQPAYRMTEEEPFETQASGKSIYTENEFVLLQNDPNPFSDYTDIQISVPESSKNVSLLIVDMKGSVVLNTPVSEASETIRVYASEIGNGIFTYYLLSEGNVIASRKMVSSKQ